MREAFEKSQNSIRSFTKTFNGKRLQIRKAVQESVQRVILPSGISKYICQQRKSYKRGRWHDHEWHEYETH